MSILILGMILAFIKAIIEIYDYKATKIAKTNNLFEYIFNTRY